MYKQVTSLQPHRVHPPATVATRTSGRSLGSGFFPTSWLVLQQPRVLISAYATTARPRSPRSCNSAKGDIVLKTKQYVLNAITPYSYQPRNAYNQHLVPFSACASPIADTQPIQHTTSRLSASQRANIERVKESITAQRGEPTLQPSGRQVTPATSDDKSDSCLPPSANNDSDTVDHSHQTRDHPAKVVPKLEQNMPAHFEQWYRSAEVLRSRRNLSRNDPLRAEEPVMLPAARPGYGFLNTSKSSRQRQAVNYFLRHAAQYITQDGTLGDIPPQKLEALRTLVSQLDPAGKQLDFDRLCRYTWILSADPELATGRLAKLEVLQADNKEESTVQLWVILQILRSNQATSRAMFAIIDYIQRHKLHWDWLGDSAFIVTTRLLRHARYRDPSLYQSAVTLFLDLLPLRFKSTHENPRDRSRMASWCNDVLKLLSRPHNLMPFEGMIYQQNAQVKLGTYMTQQNPPIPLNRLGYRSLYRTQLMHAKTPEEIAWTLAQSLKWPPWKDEDRMGLDAPTESFANHRSRTLKVLEHMQTAGYGLDIPDLAHRILAGRDTDYSPTLQVRRSSSVIQSSPNPTASFDDLQTPQSEALIWAARIEATRTMREAWMCFCSFEDSTPVKTQHSHRVYHATCRKLWADTLSRHGASVVGDSGLLWPEPESMRNQVYIPREIPTVEDFVTKMVQQDKILIQGPLLGDLLRRYQGRDLGSWLIEHSSIDETKRRVLADPENHSIENLASILDTLPSYLVRSYLKWLSSLSIDKKRTFAHFSTAITATLRRRNDGLAYDCLKAITRYGGLSSDQRSIVTLHDIWSLTDAALEMSESEDVNHHILLPLAQITFRIQTSQHEALAKVSIDRMKQVFTQVFTRDNISWRKFCTSVIQTQGNKPLTLTGDILESFFWVFAAKCDQEALLDAIALLSWVHRNRRSLKSNTISIRNMSAVRIVLQGLWADEDQRMTTISPFNQQQMNVIRQYCKDLRHWPDDVETYQARSEIRTIMELLKTIWRGRQANKSHEGTPSARSLDFNNVFEMITGNPDKSTLVYKV